MEYRLTIYENKSGNCVLQLVSEIENLVKMCKHFSQDFSLADYNYTIAACDKSCLLYLLCSLDRKLGYTIYNEIKTDELGPICKLVQSLELKKSPESIC